MSEKLSVYEYIDLLNLTNKLRLERQKAEARQRGEIHPEERREAEEALDKTLNQLGGIEIDGVKFGFGNHQQKVQPPVNKRKEKES